MKLSSECKNIRKGTACTSEAAKNQGPCRGDPGSPVFDRSARGEAIVVGVQGGEKTCGPKGNPGIVTKIEHYVSWISKTMRYGLNVKDTRKCALKKISVASIILEKIFDYEICRDPSSAP